MLRSSGIYDEMSRIKRRVFPRIKTTKEAALAEESAVYKNNLTSRQIDNLNTLFEKDDYRIQEQL